MNLTKLNKAVEEKVKHLGKREYEEQKDKMVKQKSLDEEMAHRQFEKGEVTGSELQSMLQNIRSKYGQTLQSLQDKHL